MFYLTGRVSLSIEICALEGIAFAMGIFLYWICIWYHAQLLTGLFLNWNWLQIYPCLKRKNSFLWMEIFVCPLVENTWNVGSFSIPLFTCWPPEWVLYISADKSLAQPGRKQATVTEDFDVYISCL